MKNLHSLLFILLWGLNVYSQCDPVALSSANFTITYVDSENGNNPAAHVFDEDPTSYWRTNGNDPFPHDLQIDLGNTYAISQLAIAPRQDNENGKLAKFEIYTSEDGQDWASLEASGQFIYESFSDVNTQFISFGAIDTRYIRVLAQSNFDPSNIHRLLISEITIFENPCGSEGKENQVIDFPDISKQLTTTGSFEPPASASSGLPIEFEIVDGPAEVQNGTLVFTGEEGQIIVKAKQAGDDTYYAAEYLQYFEVIDPANYEPVIQSRLTNTYPIEMNSLKPYPLYASASIEHSDVLSIEQIKFIINGATYNGVGADGNFEYWWQPEDFGPQNIVVRAIASNGASIEKTIDVEIVEPEDDRFVRTFEENLINYDGSGASRWFYGTYKLPQFVGTYQQVMAEFWVTCPNVDGACDDWDRKAWIEVKAPDGTWVEIIRYITPYGVGCNGWLDVSDYAMLLQGEMEFRMFIDTWGTGGWNINLRFDYFLGTPEYEYPMVQPLWRGTFPFGNPANLQPVPILEVDIPQSAMAAKFKLVTTGHGWGPNNTGNAAEFYHAYHDLVVNETTFLEQDLWTLCNPNPDGCQPQGGTWEFDRAGWCPGAIAPVYEFDFSEYIGSPFSLQYLFDENYMDYCHAEHPDCESGFTCENCNDGFNPSYEVAGNLILYMETPVVSNSTEIIIADKKLRLVPNPVEDHFQIIAPDATQNISVQIKAVTGQLINQYYFEKGVQLNSYQFDSAALPSGAYWVTVYGDGFLETQQLIKN